MADAGQINAREREVPVPIECRTAVGRRTGGRYAPVMHFDAHAPVIADFEARILTIRDSL